MDDLILYCKLIEIINDCENSLGQFTDQLDENERIFNRTFSENFQAIYSSELEKARTVCDELDKKLEKLQAEIKVRMVMADMR